MTGQLENAGSTSRAKLLKRIIVLANLEPRRVRGVDSHGMLLAAEWEGQVALLTVEKNAPKGAKIT